MKKTFKSVIAVTLCFIMLMGTVAVGGDGFAELLDAISIKAEAYSIGDYIYYGTYPQTDVTDSLGSVLNSQSGTWKSYGYYSGSGSWSDGEMVASDYMRYKDVTYNGNKYRAVTFDSYRPYFTCYTSSTSDTYQDENGYTPNNVYWFKYEPIKWCVLDPSTGLVMCATAIDSQAYNNYIWDGVGSLSSFSEYYGNSDHTFYASNYAQSSIRQWLNNDFYNTAFSSEQKSNILSTTLDNKSTYSSTYDSPSTTDKVFLLSYEDSINSSYGFSSSYSDYDSARQLKSTDYAKAQGCYQDTSSSYLGNCWWWLRSPDYSYSARDVGGNGHSDGSSDVVFTFFGVVPALKLQNLKSDYAGSDIEAGGGDSAGSISVPFYVRKNRSIKVETKWEWSDFTNDNSQYNQRLAINSLLLSKATETDHFRTEYVYKQFGFENIKHYDYAVEETFSPAATFASKKTSDGKIIVSCAFRGSTTTEDWVTDGLALLDGFNTGITKETGTLVNYVADVVSTYGGNYDWDDIKIHITGHSYGAAIAEGVAMSIVNSGAKSDNIYAYTFAAPCIFEIENGTDNEGIHNIINAHDPVVYLPDAIRNPVWNYDSGHFGNTYCIGDTSVLNYTVVEAIYGNTPDCLYNLTVDVGYHLLPMYLSFLFSKSPSTEGSYCTNTYSDSNIKSANIVSYKQCHTGDYSTYSSYAKKYLNGASVALYKDGNLDTCIPGFTEKLIPQAITYYKAKHWYLVGAYDKEGKQPCVIFALDEYTGECVAQFDLYNHDGSKNMGHMGGIAVSNNNLYISDSVPGDGNDYCSTIAYIPLSELDVQKYEKKKITIEDSCNISSSMNNTYPAYLSCSNEDGKVYLWTGNFYNKSYKEANYTTPAYGTSGGYSNSILLGYKLYGNTSEEEWSNFENYRNLQKNHYLIRIPDEFHSVQGATYSNGVVYLSCTPFKTFSGGAAVLSAAIYAFEVNLGNEPQIFLNKDKSAVIKNITGAENIYIDNGYMYGVYESGSPEYSGSILTGLRTDIIWKTNVEKMLKDTNVHIMNCPVDVDVYDKDTGELVASIKDNEVNEEIASLENAVPVMVSGDSKYVWLPTTGNYEIKITGNDEGVLDYTVKEFNSDLQEEERVNFFSLNVTDGCTYTGIVENDTFVLKDYTITGDNGKIIEPTETIENTSETFSITVSSQGDGTATESFTAVSGDKVSVNAEPSSDNCFLGWYENGTLVSNEATYSFVAKDNRTLVAKFEEHNKGNVVSTVAPTCTKDGSTTYQCSVCNESFTVVVPATGHADKNEDGKCDTCGVITNADLANPTRNAKINVAAAKTVDYKSKVTIKATATGVPKGYYLAIYDANGKQLAKAASDGKSTTEVTYEAGNITSDINYTVKVVDAKGNIQKDASGNDLAKDSKVTCNASFFKKLVAFFKSLFGSLPSTIVKP